ncbi:MAG: multicopper oxidase domain-containing protein [Crocinitomicaceae bacterium]|nr:multicopper oxidase domain-containing protein [Crocinitomicaceae bacterium]
MKSLLLLLASNATLHAFCQQPLAIPDTLQGPNISLVMHQDSVQFFPGQISYTYAFNTANFLGPTLILNQGDNVNITVENLIGDTTTVHWHGIHLPAVYDGGPHTPILPGEIWNPSFTVMDHAATYWYHPHMHMKTAEQAIKGAAGLIIVNDPIEAALDLPRDYGVDDFPLVVQCQEWDANNQVLPLGMQDSIVMINGTLDPYLDIPAQVVRFRMLNASGERTFNFGFTGNMPFYQIASDGGLLNDPVLTTRVRLSPGERAEVLLDVSAMLGQTFYLMCYGTELPMGVQGGPTMPMPPGSPPMDSPLNGVDYNMMQLNVVAATPGAVTSIPLSLATNTPHLESSADAYRTIKFTADSAMVMDGPFYFNDSTFNMMRIDYTIPLNSVEVWELINETMVAHPFHIHDVQFFILNRNSIPPTAQESGRKDVVLVASGDTLRFITKFEDFADPVIPYMYHCHILMHEDDGMMGQFIVHPSAIGLDESEKENSLTVYPNPANDILTVILDNHPESGMVKYEIVDISGKIVAMGNCIVYDKKMQLDVSELSPGTYLVQVRINNELQIIKMLK